MNQFISPKELWEEFQTETPTNVTLLQTDQFGEYVYEQIMFDGQKTHDGVCRVFAVLAYPRNTKTPLPCVVLVHDFGGRVDFSYIDYFLHMGVAVLMCDYSGAREGERHTIYPPSLAHLNFSKDSQEDFSLPLSQSLWLNATMIFRSALGFLRSQNSIDKSKIGVVSFGSGSICGFHLAYCEPTLAFSCNFHYGGWRDFEEHMSNIDSDSARYILAIAPQVYSPLARVPFFLLGSTNTDMCDSDRCFDTFARGNGGVSSLLYLSPNYISTVDHLATRNLRLIINQYLLNADISIPPSPRISHYISDGELFVSCEIEEEYQATRVFLEFSQGDNPPQLRSWNSVELVLSSSGNYVGHVPCSSALPTVMFANVAYSCGYTHTSNMLKIQPFANVLLQKNILCNGTPNTFFPLGTLIFPKANQFFNEKRSVVPIVGPFDILGVSAPRLASFVLGDPCVCSEGKSLSLQIFSDLPQQIRLILSESPNSDRSHSTSIDLVGGDLWQKILLDPADFVGVDMQSLDSFRLCKLMFFTSEYDFLVSNITLV